jgi:hypothetical protein
MVTIQVSPLETGWRVSADTLANDMVFQSGAAAEAAARRLAIALAESGAGADLRITLRDGSRGPRLVWPPGAATAQALRAA